MGSAEACRDDPGRSGVPPHGGRRLPGSQALIASPRRDPVGCGMTRYTLRLLEDRLPKAGDPVYLPRLSRALYVVEGDATVELPDGGIHHAAGSAWIGAEQIGVVPGADGARVLRWELAPHGAAENGILHGAPQATS